MKFKVLKPIPLSLKTMSSIITAQNLSMRFRHCEALSNVNLDVAPGTVFAILGENGAGKTTLIKILTGFLEPTAGSCQILGLDPRRDALEIRRRIGYVSDSPALYDWMRVDEIGWFLPVLITNLLITSHWTGRSARPTICRDHISDNLPPKHVGNSCKLHPH